MRILLIADPAEESDLMPVLEEEGLAVEVADTLERANFKLQTRSHEAVLFDRRVDSVMEVLPRWRREGVKAHIIILLPRSSGAHDRAGCLNAGADVSLTRPVSVKELCAHLRALSRRDRPSKAPVWRIHDVEINVDVRTVHRARRRIHLTAREFDLLYLLVSHQGKVLTRSAIIEHLYDDREHGYSNIVDVYIRYLRIKIDEGFEKPLILTRWGEGYLLRPEEALVE